MPLSKPLKTIGKDQAWDILAAVLQSKEFLICEYVAEDDVLVIYEEGMEVRKEIPHYCAHLRHGSAIHPEDRAKAVELYRAGDAGTAEIRLVSEKGTTRHLVQALAVSDSAPGNRTFIVRDVTQARQREQLLEEQATRDPLTGLYNFATGRQLINEYLRDKDPYATCGLIVVDVDYFKYANDTFGHLFGDQALVELARLLTETFEEGDVIMRFGGDEFAILAKDIGHAGLVRKGMQVVESVRGLAFGSKDYSMTCSVGVCYLPENENGYTYDQLFENADWALYQAKDNGKDQYVFCDHLRRFEQTEDRTPDDDGSIDPRYLRNDIISTAFEIFEKMSTFPLAMDQLMKVIGHRLRLDRITVIRTDIREQNTGRQFQWTSEYAPEVLEEKAEFTKEDFLTLFHGYDEYQTIVLQSDNMSMYSPGGAALLMQGGAKTVLYAAMYCEGKYTGAISYVTCRERRYWSRQERKELGEVTKIISAHLARTLATGALDERRLDLVGHDSLTGLMSFSRFRSDLERLIVGGYAAGDYLLYLDFVGFKFFNQKYGYSQGDKFLKEFCAYAISTIGANEGVYFARVVSDQFLLLVPGKGQEGLVSDFERFCEGFFARESGRLQGFLPQIRVGAYRIEPDCAGASYAIDAANYARVQISGKERGRFGAVRVYDDELRRKRQLENAIYSEIGEALREDRFKVYLQPKYSLADGLVTGAEALVRWETKDGRLLSPDQFIPLCESSGMIRDLDFHVFERVAGFLAKNERLGRRQVPISVNASILHASDEGTAERYRSILERHGVDPRYAEIELTETATVDEYEDAKRLFAELRAMGIRTAIDDFGAGYSVLNAILDVPADTMKLDRAFIANCTASRKKIIFLQSMIEMVHGLGYRVVCEGVETREQADILREAGCEEAQGFLFARPMSVEEYERLVYPEG